MVALLIVPLIVKYEVTGMVIWALMGTAILIVGIAIAVSKKEIPEELSSQADAPKETAKVTVSVK